MERTRRRHIRWDRVLKSIFFAAIFVLVAWVVVSYVNIVLHNTEAHPVYFRWNFFSNVF